MPKAFATHAQGLTCATTPPPSLRLLPASLPGGDASTTKLTESVSTLLMVSRRRMRSRSGTCIQTRRFLTVLGSLPGVDGKRENY